MKLLIYSDLHLEWSDFHPDRQAVDQADVVILAGDIWTGAKGITWAQKTFAGKPVVFVAGNHEFYGSKRPEQLAEMRTLAAGSNVHFLDCDAVEIGGAWFLGATLWTDYELHAEPGETQAQAAVSRQLAMGNVQHFLQDHKSIREVSGRHGKWRPAMAYAQHIAARVWLANTLAELRAQEPDFSLAKPRIVVTHHAPAAEGLGDLLHDTLSPGYASRLPPEAFEGVDVWIHGHIHKRQDYRHHHGSRILANPRGYPKRPMQILHGADHNKDGGHDNPDFRHLLIEV